jgi:hypothetical protein
VKGIAVVRWLQLLLVGLTGVVASGQASWVVWDRDLSVMRGHLVSIGAAGVQIEGADGVRVSLERDRLAAVLLDDAHSWSQASRGASRVRVGRSLPTKIHLTDGQRWFGQLLADQDSSGEVLSFEVLRLGPVEIPIDQIVSLEFAPSDRTGPAESLREDVVLLVNGDRLDGTVLAIGTEVEIETRRGTLKVLRENIETVLLINKASLPPRTRVWMNDGQVFGGGGLEGIGLSDVSIEAHGPRDSSEGESRVGAVRLWEPERDSVVMGVEFLPSRLLAWSALDVVSAVAEPGRRWTQPVRREGPMLLGGSTIAFPGPMAVTWQLPRGGERACGEVSLGERSGVWAECDVRVEQDGEVLWTSTLTAESPNAAFSVALGSSRSVTVRVVSGRYGPIQNEVTLRLGWIMLEAAVETGR